MGIRLVTLHYKCDSNIMYCLGLFDVLFLNYNYKIRCHTTITNELHDKQVRQLICYQLQKATRLFLGSNSSIRFHNWPQTFRSSADVMAKDCFTSESIE